MTGDMLDSLPPIPMVRQRRMLGRRHPAEPMFALRYLRELQRPLLTAPSPAVPVEVAE